MKQRGEARGMRGNAVLHPRRATPGFEDQLHRYAAVDKAWYHYFSFYDHDNILLI